MAKKNNFEDKEKKLRENFLEQAKRAIALRDKDREFHGVEREFLYHQAQMTVDYERSKSIHHARDVGNVRETILREFLSCNGCLPKKYSVSTTSVRVASPSGHLSREMDIVIYDADELITLMDRKDIYEVYPVENTYGVIQVKSNLTTKELKSGLENLRSYKKLKPNGFAILFAYCSDMNWDLIIKHLKEYANQNKNEYYPNFIFILNRSFFAFGSTEKASFINSEISTLTDTTVYGYPDRQQQNLYQFQLMLLELCRLGNVGTVKLQDYFSLPLVAGDSSYRFHLGSYAEVGNCKEHGDFSRKISSENVIKISDWCKKQEPINSVKATHIAFGIPEDEEAYLRQPGMVYIYNPDSLELPDILTYNKDFGEYTIPAVAYDSKIIDDMCIQLPYYYSIKENLITGCSKCSK